jgi:POT family proton-dependent oligopeptide transporter
MATKGKWSLNPAQTRKNFKSERFWEDVKPSHLGASKPGWMQFDDTWIPLYCEFLSFSSGRAEN